jgi:hypothetical protein
VALNGDVELEGSSGAWTTTKRLRRMYARQISWSLSFLRLVMLVAA